MEKVIVVIGPTSVGKTKMGIELAKRYQGEVISGDSMQVYKGMDIGTAKVTKEEMDGIVHHLIDIVEVDQEYHVKAFQKEVRQAIDIIIDNGKIPIIVGGTGFYIKAALYDYVFEEEQDNDCTSEKYKDYNNEQLYDVLKSIDEKACETIHQNNRKRVLRAIAIYEKNKINKSEIEAKQEHKLLYDVYFVALTLDRELLYHRINDRVDKMMENGLLEEVKQITKEGNLKGLRSFEGIGYKEFFGYFDGLQTLDATINQIKQHSRNFAKRQYTWFRNQFDVNWFNTNLDDFTQTVDEVSKSINDWINSSP